MPAIIRTHPLAAACPALLGPGPPSPPPPNPSPWPHHRCQCPHPPPCSRACRAIIHTYVPLHVSALSPCVILACRARPAMVDGILVRARACAYICVKNIIVLACSRPLQLVFEGLWQRARVERELAGCSLHVLYLQEQGGSRSSGRVPHARGGGGGGSQIMQLK